MSDSPSPAALECLAIEAAHAGGSVLRARFRGAVPLRVESKGEHDYVTEVDRAAERAVIERIHRAFPAHGVMAEEGTPSAGVSDHRWVVDPLDGTTNFIHGIPMFATSVAVEDAQGLVAGAVHDPIHGETFHAFRGGGARLNGNPIHCSSVRELGPALLATGFPFREFARLREYLTAFEVFARKSSGLRRAGSASLDLVHTACGRYDGFWEVGLSRWDIAAGALVVLEAGGMVTDVVGGASYLDSGEIVAAGATLHPELVRVTREAFGHR